eukprot:m.143117 g.143117  ORF g.143117 m.143117 type:complete len:150 (+) comp38378_c0_seq19:119-568(+)
MDEGPWKCVRPKFPELIQALKPKLLLDSLFQNKLIEREEYIRLIAQPTQQDAARSLLFDMLMPRLPKQKIFRLFCKVLKGHPQQREIFEELIKPYIDDDEDLGEIMTDQPGTVLVGGEATEANKDVRFRLPCMHARPSFFCLGFTAAVG